MWDNPRLLNGISAGLLAVAMLLAAWGVYYTVITSKFFPLRVVRVQGELTHVSREQLEQALSGRVTGNFFGLDLDAVRGTVSGLPWVRKVSVRRAWPDRIDLAIEEHVALARWGDDRLVSIHGEVFQGGAIEAAHASLPLFYGPAASERQVTERYRIFRQVLAPLSLEPRQVLLSTRYAWRLRLSNGLTVELGRESSPDQVVERLTRFVAVYPQTLGRLKRRLDYVDLRYPNGFALRVPELNNIDTDRKPARKRA